MTKFFLLSPSMKLKNTPVKKLHNRHNQWKYRKQAIFLDTGLLWNRKCGNSPLWGFHFFHCSIFSLLAMSQTLPQSQSCSAAAVQAPKSPKVNHLFDQENEKRNSMDQKVCKEPPLCFSYHFIMKIVQVLQNCTAAQAYGMGYNSWERETPSFYPENQERSFLGETVWRKDQRKDLERAPLIQCIKNLS